MLADVQEAMHIQGDLIYGIIEVCVWHKWEYGLTIVLGYNYTFPSGWRQNKRGRGGLFQQAFY